MRFPIWEKDDFFQFGGERIDMDPAVVDVKEQELPLFYGYVFHVDPIGKVTDIRLEGGEITGEVEFYDNGKDFALLMLPTGDYPAMCRLGGYYMEVSRGATRVSACTLKAVSVMLMQNTPGWADKPHNT